MKMEQRECSEKSAYKIQTPGNYPEERIQQECKYPNVQEHNLSSHRSGLQDFNL